METAPGREPSIQPAAEARPAKHPEQSATAREQSDRQPGRRRPQIIRASSSLREKPKRQHTGPAASE